MIDNAVLRLRAERLARATRPFLARGNRIRRCQRCLLPLKQCLCATLVPAQATSRFCLVMFDTEPMKPSNTGRLIADILPDTEAYQWSRTEPPQGLLDLVAHPDYQPMVVFPASYAGPERQVLSAPPSGKPPLFIMLDGTWTEARKMFRKSPYLDALPIISVDLSRISAYYLREAHATDNTVPRKWRSPCWTWRVMPRPPQRLANTSLVSGPAIWREKPSIRAASQRTR